MAKIVIKGIPGIDGEYELDQSKQFTSRELHIIKKETGVRVGEFEEAIKAGDHDLIIAFAYIALRRAGSAIRNADLLWDAEAGSIDLVADKEEAAPAGPPSPPQTASD